MAHSTQYTKNCKLTPKPTPNPPNFRPKRTVVQQTTQDNQTETDYDPPDTLSDDPDPHASTICHHTNPPQPWRTNQRKPVKNTQKQGTTEGETHEHPPFAPATHIQRTTQCVQHPHLTVQRIASRHTHTQRKINPPLAQLRAPPSHLSHATLNVFVNDGRRLQTKTCVEKGFFENKNAYKNPY